MTDSDKKNISRDLKIMWGVSTVLLVVILSFVLFSPYSVQYVNKVPSDCLAELSKLEGFVERESHQTPQIPFTGKPYSNKARLGARKSSVKKYDLSYQRNESLDILTAVDSIIAEKQQNLPRFAYFDRYLSEQDRLKAGKIRSEIYELQWTRIKIMESAGSFRALKETLKPYRHIVGYHQKEAEDLYQLYQ